MFLAGGSSHSDDGSQSTIIVLFPFLPGQTDGKSQKTINSFFVRCLA